MKKKVFIVHGQDELPKEKVARFVSQIGLEPIILHEQVSGSQTIIEKIEKYADQVCFAIVLYTPCDRGARASETTARYRARQNVVFEHGYFIAKLGRSKVTAVVKGNIEIPNDFSGVVYVPFDDGESWKLSLAREMKAAGCDIDLSALV
jgi:predicted nucleotide-binding protein